MITKEEFSAALDVVEAYQKQVYGTLSTAERLSGVTVREFVRDVEISYRLRNALSNFLELGCEREIFLEEIDRYEFSKSRNAGRLTWAEFSEKRDRYIRERQQ